MHLALFPLKIRLFPAGEFLKKQIKISFCLIKYLITETIGWGIASKVIVKGFFLSFNISFLFTHERNENHLFPEYIHCQIPWSSLLLHFWRFLLLQLEIETLSPLTGLYDNLSIHRTFNSVYIHRGFDLLSRLATDKKKSWLLKKMPPTVKTIEGLFRMIGRIEGFLQCFSEGWLTAEGAGWPALLPACDR